jgi:hypothetical protein
MSSQRVSFEQKRICKTRESSQGVSQLRVPVIHKSVGGAA